MLKRIDQLAVGDLVDLACDPFADANGAGEYHISFECEYAVVTMLDRETAECIAVSFDGIDTFGFPPQHMVCVA